MKKLNITINVTTPQPKKNKDRKIEFIVASAAVAQVLIEIIKLFLGA